MRSMRPPTGLRFTWQSNTLMKMERRIAEEVVAPERYDRAEPAERRPQPKQNDGRERKAADEGIPLRMDRRELRADGIDDGHCASLPRHSAASAAAGRSSSTWGGLRLGATFSASTSAR